MTRPTLVFLHALGTSAGEWACVTDSLAGYRCVALDLPGFGGAVNAGCMNVDTMTDWLADAIRSLDARSCVLVGHSMGGKIVTMVAARAAAGEAGLSGVLGVVLVAASPPSPEPMDEGRRAEMIAWFANGPVSGANAETFIDANTAEPLSGSLRDTAIDDVLRSCREAWIDWLERGSREDWSDRAGRIDIPALIIAGAEDGDLGEDAQRRLNAPHYVTADLQVVAGAAHLIPYEQPRTLAALIDGHVAKVAQAALPAHLARLLGSDRVSRNTRSAMLKRIRPPEPGQTDWTREQHAIVATLIAHILPNCGPDAMLARRIVDAVASGSGDGWRFAALPADGEAWIRGMATLDAMTGGFAALDFDAQAGWLDRMAAGDAGIADDGAHLSLEQMKLWFEDVRAEVVRGWMSLPSSMAVIDYDGFAVGGDGRRKQGYTRTAADDLETWQRAAERMA